MALIETGSDSGILRIRTIEPQLVDELVLQQWQKELPGALQMSPERKVIVDFGRTICLTSAALGVLVRANKKCREGNRAVKLCSLTSGLRSLFRVTVLEKIFSIYPSATEAIAAFNQEGSGPEGTSGILARIKPRPSGGTASKSPDED